MLSFIAALAFTTQAQPIEDTVASIRKKGLTELGAYSLLDELTSKIGGRVSGSPEAAKAVIWVHKKLMGMGATNVSEVACMVPHWTRGKGEKAEMNNNFQLSIWPLGVALPLHPKGLRRKWSKFNL
jgi:carboxypeptidase Q